MLLIEPIPTIVYTTDTIDTHSLSTYSHPSDAIMVTTTKSTNMYTPSTATLTSTLFSSPIPSHIYSLDNTPHFTNTPSKSSNRLSLTLFVAISTPFISDDTASPPPTVSPSSTSVNDSLISNPSTIESIRATNQSSGSIANNILILAISVVFMVLVVTLLVIILGSVLVCRRRFKKGNDTSENERYTPHNNNIEQQPQGTYSVYSLTNQKYHSILLLLLLLLLFVRL